MLSNTGTSGYIQRLKKKKDLQEVDVVLMAVFFDLELEVYFIDNSKVNSQPFKLYSNILNNKKTIRLYLRPDNKFDLLYEKQKEENAGICQSIVFDVSSFN
jgi:hypothetical protein